MVQKSKDDTKDPKELSKALACEGIGHKGVYQDPSVWFKSKKRTGLEPKGVAQDYSRMRYKTQRCGSSTKDKFQGWVQILWLRAQRYGLIPCDQQKYRPRHNCELEHIF